MTEEQVELADLVRRLQQGCDEAARELVEKYGPYLLRVVRRRLHPRLRTRFDSADFVQAVWVSFFANRAELRSFQRAEDIVAFLARMAQHKVTEGVRQQLGTGKRDLTREQSLDDSAVVGHLSELAGPGPTPS